MQNEYLITFKQNTELCADEDKLINFLGAHKDITFSQSDTEKVIQFQSQIFPYTLVRHTLGNDAIGYILTVTKPDSADVKTFKELLRAIKSIIMEIKYAKLITLQDDIAKHNCLQAYPIIYETENLMRKLIYQIMNLGKGDDWRDKTIPSEVEQSVKNKLKDRDENFLHNVDFIQLSNYLFNPYVEKDDFADFLRGCLKKKNKTIDTQDLMPYLPRSNWDRYFKDKVKVESEQLKKQWEALYEIRNAIAHCRDISEQQFEILKKTSAELEGKLKDALNNIYQMDEAQQQELAESLDKGTASIDYNDLLSDAEKCLQQALEDIELGNARETVSRNCRLADKYLSQVLNQDTISFQERIDIKTARTRVVKAAVVNAFSSDVAKDYIKQAIQIIQKWIIPF